MFVFRLKRASGMHAGVRAICEGEAQPGNLLAPASAPLELESVRTVAF